MPNQCYQQVEIRGPSTLVRELYEHLLSEEDPKFCQLVCPMPFGIYAAPTTRELGGHETPAWYAWRINNWGTKWDVADVQLTSPLMIHDKDVRSFTFNCWTAWSPPVGVWDKLHSMGISVDADYQDECGNFEGRYVDGVNESWEPEVLDEEDV